MSAALAYVIVGFLCMGLGYALGRDNGYDRGWLDHSESKPAAVRRSMDALLQRIDAESGVEDAT